MNINPNQLRNLMKNVKMNQVEAKEVLIKRDKENIVIKEPKVMELRMRGKKTYQISGKIEKVKDQKSSEGDVKLVMEKAGVNKEEAEKALKEEDGEVAQAILKLK